MATSTQINALRGTNVARGRAGRGNRDKLEGVDGGRRRFPVLEPSGGDSNSGHTLGNHKMNTLKLLIGGTILGLFVNALAPSIPSTEIQKKDCTVVIECEPGKAIK